MALGIVNTISRTSTSGIEVGDVINFTATSGSSNITLTWNDPNDVSVAGALLAVWAGTLIIRKEGSEPVHKSDGTIVVNSTTRNQYSTTGFVDNKVQSGKTYYYKAFPYSAGSVYTSGSVRRGRMSSTVIALPTVTNTTFEYDKDSHSPNITYDTENSQLSGVTANTEGGTYTLTFSLTNNNAIWSDNTVDDKTFEWTITPKEPVFNIITNAKDWNTEEYIEVVNGVEMRCQTYYYFSNVPGQTEIAIPFEHEGGPITNATIRDNNIIITSFTPGKVEDQPYFDTGTIMYSSPTNNYKAKKITLYVFYREYKYYTVKIDVNQSDPALACTYADDAVNMTVGSSDWDDWFGYKPVLEGYVLDSDWYPLTEVELDPTNYAKDKDGNTVDITSGAKGDVFIRFPIRGVKITTETDNSTTYIVVSMTDNPNHPDYEYYAHKHFTCKSDNSDVKDNWGVLHTYFYIGAYMGYSASYDTALSTLDIDTEKRTRLRSLSGKAPTVSQNINTFRTYAINNEVKNVCTYGIMNWYQLNYLRAMYILKYKTLNSQTAIGNGRSGNVNTNNTGTLNTSGLNYGTTANTTTDVKLFGIENLWGVYGMVIDGFQIRNKVHYMYDSNVDTENFTDGYATTGKTVTTAFSNSWIKGMDVNSQLGFFPNASGGSATTYWCDAFQLNSTTTNLIPVCGGWKNQTTNLGIFRTVFAYVTTDTNSLFSARLMKYGGLVNKGRTV